MVFCNNKIGLLTYNKVKVTILILIDGFLQFNELLNYTDDIIIVTILILIDGFLQYKKVNCNPIIRDKSQSLF